MLYLVFEILFEQATNGILFERVSKGIIQNELCYFQDFHSTSI